MTVSRERSQQPHPAEDRPAAPARRPGGQQAGEQAERPDIEAVKIELRARVDRLTRQFGEADIGGPWHPGEDASIHTTEALELVSEGFQLIDVLRTCTPSDQILALLYLLRKCWDLADVSLAYRTLDAVQKATVEFAYRHAAPGHGQPPRGWERDALHVVGQVMRLITADMDIFKQINLASSEGVKAAAISSIETTAAIMEEVRSPLAALGPRTGQPGDDSDRIAAGLREIENLAQQNQIFHTAIAHAADALIEFEKWLAAAPRLGSAPSRAPASAAPGSHLAPDEPLASVDAAIGYLRHAMTSLREVIAHVSVREIIATDSLKDLLSREALSDLGGLIDQDSLGNLREVIAQSSLQDLIAAGSLGALAAHASIGELTSEEVADDQVLSRCEPWERLLIEVRDIVTAYCADDTGGVFVPRHVSVRYCYSFAIEGSEEALELLDRQGKKEPGQPFDRLRKELSENEALGAMGIEVGEVGPLMPTEFFALGSGRYGGVRVDLPEIEFGFEPPPGIDSHERGGRCKAWIVLSNMGNHCLCIQPKPLHAPAPHLLYRTLHVGTPVALGARVFLAVRPDGTRVGWDNLQTFSRDVIRAIADMRLWCPDENAPAREAMDRFVRGNLHEIVVVRTDGPLGAYPEEVARTLDRAVGGRILARSVQRTAMTLEEWVRYPPVPRTGSRGLVPVIVDIPDMGLAGDWCIHTGETTVFSIVAAPSWLSEVYVEAAQFASSWSPRLRLWNRRLESTVRSLESYTGGQESERFWRTERKQAGRLRHMERQVRLQLAQIRTEELTATKAHRGFLDQLLEMAELSRLERELEAWLEAAEKLTDWFNEQARQESDDKQQDSDRKRQVLLGIIALFGLFELGTFLGIANGTNFHQRLVFFTLRPGTWEDWVMLALFVVGIIVGIYFFSERAKTWVDRHLGT
jgi:hypothetical protein